MLDFPKFLVMEQLLVFVVLYMGCITVLKDHTSCQMIMPLLANSLVQSPWHVTEYVYMLFWISKYEYSTDDSCTIEYR